MEKFFADYNYLKEEVFEPYDEEEEDEKGEQLEEEHVQKMMMVPEESEETKEGRLKRDLKEILKVVDRQRSEVADIIRICAESEKENIQENLSVISLVHAGTRDANEAPGEFLYAKLNEMKTYVKGTKYELVPGMLQGVFVKTASYLTPQDLAKILSVDVTAAVPADVPAAVPATAPAFAPPAVEESKQVEMMSQEELKIRRSEIRARGQLAKIENLKKSGMGFPEIGLVITSTVISTTGKRAYICPIDGCDKGFVSPRTCDGHVNRHLGWEYGPCENCAFSSASRDSFDKHKCFAGVKTGGKRPPSRGEGRGKRSATSTETGATAPKK